jgi:hypothetical protein
MWLEAETGALVNTAKLTRIDTREPSTSEASWAVVGYFEDGTAVRLGHVSKESDADLKLGEIAKALQAHSVWE